ncbi:hypothetical protein A4A49_04306 [Nicotiana attenuata]|uniref:Uncharacterized protein n=1 Tax=Nicotiana attenuata TaxID=49451 RepID=A0A1J6I935_NICAT|nr:hypothetical protein A4A49_04306 [Nicotiana attenuata]
MRILLAIFPDNQLQASGFTDEKETSAKKAREVVLDVLRDVWVDSDVSIAEAVAAVKDIFAENAKQFYKLDVSKTYSDVKPQPLSPISFQKEHLNGPLTDVTLVRIIWLDFSAQHRCRVVPQQRFYSSVKMHGLA